MKRNAQIFCATIGFVTTVAISVSQEKPPVPAEGKPEDSEMAKRAKENPAFSNLPPGVSVSDLKPDSRLIETVRPERVAVYPDDPNSARWEINPRYAFLRAGREQKPLLLLFTSNENTAAMSLSEEVFSTKSFNEYVKGNLVICYLNYPRNITDAPDILRKWKKKFNVKGYPNVLVFNPEGEVDSHIIGYREGRAVDYFNDLKNKIQPVLGKIKNQKSEWERFGYRDWTGGKNDSITIFAKFLRRDTDLVTLQGVKGERWTIALDRLAVDDRVLAESFPVVGKEVGTKPK